MSVGSDRVPSIVVGLGGVGGLFVGLICFVKGGLALTSGALLILCFTAIPMILLDVLGNQVHRRSSTELTARRKRPDFLRSFRKWMGLVITVAILFFGYWLFPEYGKPEYAPVLSIARILVPATLILAIPYILYVDMRQADPQDIYAQIGGLLFGMRVDRDALVKHTLIWAVKGFFLPLMLSFLVKNLEFWRTTNCDASTFADFYRTVLSLIFVVDVSFGCVGYLLTLRLLDAHVRHAEDSPLGWIAALVCYPPLLTSFGGAYFRFKAEFEWQDVFANYPLVFVAWGSTILFLYGFYVWATISFGCRFSNLTNRGVITDGAYKFTKHPAYVSKCTAWWLEFSPFLAFGDPVMCFRACLLFGVKTFVYWVRAKTEERLMAKDPAYQAYCAWIAEHGLIAAIKRTFKINAIGILRRSE